jgi:hypothetical protein
LRLPSVAKLRLVLGVPKEFSHFLVDHGYHVPSLNHLVKTVCVEYDLKIVLVLAESYPDSVSLEPPPELLYSLGGDEPELLVHVGFGVVDPKVIVAEIGEFGHRIVCVADGLVSEDRIPGGAVLLYQVVEAVLLAILDPVKQRDPALALANAPDPGELLSCVSVEGLSNLGLVDVNAVRVP